MHAAWLGLALLLAAPAALAQPGSPWTLPVAGACAPSGGTHVRPGAPPEDAVTVPFSTGDTFAIDRLPTLERYLPDFVWKERERFFYEGMRLEIGPCFRDYGPPDFFVAATDAARAKATLAPDGGPSAGRRACRSIRPRSRAMRRTRASAGCGTCRAATRARASAGSSA
jgi:hypothetical protein